MTAINVIMALDATHIVSDGANSYDDLHENVVAILKANIEPVRSIWESKFGPDVMSAEIVVGGWSESRGRPHAFILATSETNAAYGIPAWKVTEIDGLLLSPSDQTLSADFAIIQSEFGSQFRARAVELVRRQRTVGEKPGVGAFVQITTVREHGIETRILKRWPDVVGQKLC
jgi:hypothetical protein